MVCDGYKKTRAARGSAHTIRVWQIAKMAIILFSLHLSQCDCTASLIKTWGPLLSSPETQLALWRMQWAYQRASPGPGPGPQEAPHASTRTPGSLPTPCVNKPGPVCQRMKDHMEHGRGTQLKPLRPVSPQPTQSLATAAYVSSATTERITQRSPNCWATEWWVNK